MENQAYPVRVKPGNIRMFVIPETDKPGEFENDLDRQKLLKQQVNVVRQYDAALDSVNATAPSNEPAMSSQPPPVDRYHCHAMMLWCYHRCIRTYNVRGMTIWLLRREP